MVLTLCLRKTLHFGGQLLDADHTLVFYNIVDGDTINVFHDTGHFLVATVMEPLPALLRDWILDAVQARVPSAGNGDSFVWQCPKHECRANVYPYINRKYFCGFCIYLPQWDDCTSNAVMVTCGCCGNQYGNSEEIKACPNCDFPRAFRRERALQRDPSPQEAQAAAAQPDNVDNVDNADNGDW